MKTTGTTGIDAASLLAASRRRFDETHELVSTAAIAWRGGFASGGAWMMDALEAIRGGRASGSTEVTGRRQLLRLNALGLVKNGGAALVAAVVAAGLASLAHVAAAPIGVVGAAFVAAFVVAFYAVEGQMVFLYPVLLDPRAAWHPSTLAEVVRTCRAWTLKAGGTLAVMRVVMPISASMVFGGFLGRGFLRSWCIGCIAVVAWYDALATRSGPGAGSLA